MNTADEGRAAIERWFNVALAAVDPAHAVHAHLRRRERTLEIDGNAIAIPGRLFVAAIGKAAAPMTRGALAAVGPMITGGLMLTKDGHLDAAIPDGFEAFEAGHPIPDQRGVDATERLLARLQELERGDVVLALISGGGSALLEAPLPGVSLANVARTTDLLLRAGAPIQDLNAVRIPLSRVKGGGLRRAAPHASFATLILSDVLGNDTRVIASGPTTPTTFSGEGALAVLDRYDLGQRVPAAVIEALQAAAQPGRDDLFADDIVAIVGDNAAAVDAFAGAASADGVAPRVLWSAREGEARRLAAEWVNTCLAESDADLLLGGGEATVTVRGDGVGGRNTEFVLAAALELERRGRRDWLVASLATDGQDATTGVAGAAASVETLERSRAAGIDPEAALEQNDSLAVFRAAGGCVEPGPTGTNVNDIYVALRIDRSA